MKYATDDFINTQTDKGLLDLAKKIAGLMRKNGIKDIVPNSDIDTWPREDLEYLVVNYGDSYLGDK